MTEPEQWAVVQEVETVTGDFLTEPGARFYRIVIDGYCADFDHRQAAENFVAAIQRDFEERERKLREAATELLSAQDAIDNWRGVNEGTLWIRALKRRQAALLALSQALKETPDAT